MAGRVAVFGLDDCSGRRRDEERDGAHDVRVEAARDSVHGGGQAPLSAAAGGVGIEGQVDGVVAGEFRDGPGDLARLDDQVGALANVGEGSSEHFLVIA